MDPNRRRRTDSVLKLTLEIMYLLTGEDYTVVKKTTSKLGAPTEQSQGSDGWSRSQSPITAQSALSPPPSENNDRKVLELANRIIHFLTGEVWQYLLGHKDLVKDVMIENCITDIPEDDVSYIVFSHLLKSPKIQDLGIHLLNLGQHKGKMAERILNLTLEIIYLLTGKDYELVKMISGKLLPYNSRTSDPSPIMDHPPPSLTSERNNQNQIQEVTQKVIELLTGEVPMRCQDVSVYFSMEEWEYLEGHQDLYKDVMMENRPPLTSPDGSRNRNTPETCPRPLYSRDSTQEHQEIPQEDQEIPQEHQEIPQDINLIKVEVKEEKDEDSYVRSDEPCKEEEIPPDISTDGQHAGNNPKDCPIICHDSDPEDDDITWDSSEENSATPQLMQQTVHAAGKPFSCSECGKGFSRKCNLITHERVHTGEKPFSCSECGKSFSHKSNLIYHKRSHTAEKPFPCSQCGKLFSRKSSLVTHERLHTGEKPFSCAHCGKCFSRKSFLVNHERVHTGEKPYACSECGRCFTDRSHLFYHERVHAAQKPFSCSECGKGFTQRANLLSHQRRHTGEKPYPCLECGERFTLVGSLTLHQRTHTGEKPFSCSKCGKCFSQKSTLTAHEIIHTGQKPYSCPECGKSFTTKSYLVIHCRIHTGDRPYLCSECGKDFANKMTLVRHMRVHTGDRPYSCTECGKKFADKSALNSHLRSHRRQEAALSVCDI